MNIHKTTLTTTARTVRKRLLLRSWLRKTAIISLLALTLGLAGWFEYAMRDLLQTNDAFDDYRAQHQVQSLKDATAYTTYSKSQMDDTVICTLCLMGILISLSWAGYIFCRSITVHITQTEDFRSSIAKH